MNIEGDRSFFSGEGLEPVKHLGSTGLAVVQAGGSFKDFTGKLAYALSTGETSGPIRQVVAAVGEAVR